MKTKRFFHALAAKVMPTTTAGRTARLRRLLLALVLMLPATAMRADGGAPCVVVEQTDGTKTEYLLSDAPRVSYDGKVVRLTSSTADVELAQADVLKVYLAQSIATAIGTPEARTATRVRLTADGLCLSGLEPGSTVSVAALDGRLLSGGRASADGSLTLPLNHVPDGIIVIRTSHQSFKLIRK